MSHLSWLWRNQDMTDVRLVLVRQEEPESGKPSAKRHKMATRHRSLTGKSGEVLHELPAHRTVIGSASGFFKAQLLRWDQQHAGNGSLTAALTVTSQAQVQLGLGAQAELTAPDLLRTVTATDVQLPAALLLLELMYKWEKMSWPASAALVMQELSGTLIAFKHLNRISSFSRA
mmetsp:Transcript_16617/g.28526  ORF Transcript_16617/g.28526 Transcript_16617/m.28526 type:complete len:174 (+) Transcript_16617:34-555(+)